MILMGYLVALVIFWFACSLLFVNRVDGTPIFNAAHTLTLAAIVVCVIVWLVIR